ncbi:MAG TPA: YlmC/YmxH family sporulation protein [Bacilli bacterium]|nr:YlmC/YmxH family sporulation protein [Bacilli bacterium]
MVKISELQAKDVVSLTDGKRLGQIGDLDIDLENGMIRAIIVPGGGRFLGMFGNAQDYVIPWNQIVKIGADVVLVELRSSHESPYVPPNGGSSGGF